MAEKLVHGTHYRKQRLRSRFHLEAWSWFVLTLVAGIFTALTGELVVALAFVFLAAISLAVLGYWVLSGLVRLDVSRHLSASEVEYGAPLEQLITCQPRDL